MSTAETKIPYLPERLEGLRELAMNLSWRWHRRAWRLFEQIDPALWAAGRNNPIDLLRRAGPARLAECANDAEFMKLYEAALDDFRRELTPEATWFRDRFSGSGVRPIAYFCAEFGVHSSVPIYSGGLGVLAGDHCKAASDLGVPLIAVGLLYSKGYFDQIITLDGWQEDSDETFDPSSTPLTRVLGPGGDVPLASVTTSGREVHIAAWKLLVGKVPIYLLDTRLEENDPADRDLTSKLYGEGLELRLKQEWILGVGGVRVLRALGIDPGAWHANEGHATFMLLERLRELQAEGVDVDEGIRQVRARSIFTTHTPVPAGHDTFSADLIASCTGDYWEQLGVNRDAFLRLGFHPETNHESFHMTAAAIRLSGRVNAVSKRNGQETSFIWRKLWPGRKPDEVPIGVITNGVHLSSWMSHAVLDLLDECLGEDWKTRWDDPGLWDGVLEMDDEQLWRVHLELKERLLSFSREYARQRWRDLWSEAVHLVGAGTLLSPEPLTIGFARRFA
ncbi:MAG: alpha-glucan family phosphorylase, partial [Gemmatimonadales bacterium]